MAISSAVPPFEPPRWLRSGHAQTVVARCWPSPRVRLRATYHEVVLEDGDRLAVLDSVPSGWRRGHPVALLVHGLAGCARSPYVVRVAARLVERGIRAVRMNLRGAGAGFGGARRFYHGGGSQDLRAVTKWIGGRAPGSPIGLVGFSLGGNLALKLAAEAAEEPVEGLDCVLAASPPLDLGACARHIQRPGNRIYDRNFVQLLTREVRRLHERFPELGPVNVPTAHSLYEFDELYTAPRNGFRGAEDYYSRCSSGPTLERICVPGLVVHAADDPFIPPETLEEAVFPPHLRLELSPHGGHLGFLSRRPWQGSYRWLDVRLTQWLADHWLNFKLNWFPTEQSKHGRCNRLCPAEARDGGLRHDVSDSRDEQQVS